MEATTAKPIFTITANKNSISPAKQKQIKEEFEAQGAAVIFVLYNDNNPIPAIARHQ